MKLIKEYLCDWQPSEEEIREGMRTAQTESCVVRLNWFVGYSGWYRVIINEDTSFEECVKQIPKCYSV